MHIFLKQYTLCICNIKIFLGNFKMGRPRTSGFPLVFLNFAKKLINFRPSYRHDFGVFCVGKVERDPPLNLTWSIMKWEVQKTARKCAPRVLYEEYLVNKLNKNVLINIFFYKNHYTISIYIFVLYNYNIFCITKILI